MKHNRVSVIGAGNVGATTCYALLLKNSTAEILLSDINQDLCEGHVRDLSDALPFSDTSKVFSADLKEAGKSDVIVITAGAAQKPGQTRLDLVDTNKKIIASILEQMQPGSGSVILMVSNPVDVLTYHAQNILKERPHGKTFGSGTYLDTQRLRGELSSLLKIGESSIHAYVLGEHGNSQFVAWSESSVGGKPILDFLESNESMKRDIAEHTMKEAYEIIAKKGSTYYGIAACITEICESILYDQKRIFPVSCRLEEYNITLSMPAVIGENGIEKIIKLNLNPDEMKLFENSMNQIRPYL
ncbi:MAG: L-lactate dehydrogenase [Spirochaetia bacterium]|nr:L-lactate dehydrogenase [Spirochaetia bacterium]